MTLALITGLGDLPRHLAAACETPPLVCAFEGTTPAGLAPDLTFRLETLGTLLVALGERGVTEVCFAGGVDRPALDPSKLDEETRPLVPLFMEALAKGDDGALSAAVDLFERTGFTVHAAQDVAPHLLAEGGVYSEAWPDARTREDAAVGAAHIAEMGPRDIGQACIVRAGQVVAMEDRAGTDAMIAGAGPFGPGAPALLFKGPKPQQSRRIDLPTVGPETIGAAAAAGLAAVVIDAGGVLVLDRDRCAALADAHGLIFWARTGE